WIGALMESGEGASSRVGARQSHPILGDVITHGSARLEQGGQTMAEIPTADWSRINDAADRFERAWKQGPRPRIEDYLAEAEPGLRAALLPELLRVERELRRREGEEPGPEEYSLRFSQHADLIQAVFGPGPDRSETQDQQPDLATTPPGTADRHAEADGD